MDIEALHSLKGTSPEEFDRIRKGILALATKENRMDNPVHLPEPSPKYGFEHITGITHDGEEVELYVEQDVYVSYVSIQTPHIGYLQFNFNPDFPEDAKKFFLALCEVRSIIQQDK